MPRKRKRRKKRKECLAREVRALRPEPKRFIRVYEDTDAVFRAAIASGALSAGAGERLYAGRFHYMFHDEEGTAWFRRQDAAEWVGVNDPLCAVDWL